MRYGEGYVSYCDNTLIIDRDIDRYDHQILLDIYTAIKHWCAGIYSISNDVIKLIVDGDSRRQDRRFDYNVSVGRKFAIDLSFSGINEFVSVPEYIDTVVSEFTRNIDRHVRQYNNTRWADILLTAPEWNLGAWGDENRYPIYPDVSPYRVNPQGDWTYGTVVSVTTRPIENEKAKKLLWSCLSRKQKKMYKQDKTFIAIGNVTGIRYLIQNKTQINIVQLDDDNNWVEKLCTVPTERIPVEDHQLAQKLMIETEEDVFLDKVIRWNI